MTYELNFSSRWQIHSIVFVTQLELTSSKKNFYNRFKLDYANEIEIKNMSNIVFEKNYEIEIIVDKKQRKYNKIVVTQYLIKWKSWSKKYDEWKSIATLIDSIELIENYERRHFKSFDKISWKIDLKKFFVKQANTLIISIRLRLIKSITQHVSRFKTIMLSSFNNHYYRDEMFIDKVK